MKRVTAAGLVTLMAASLLGGCMTYRHLPDPTAATTTDPLPVTLNIQAPAVDLSKAPMMSNQQEPVATALAREMQSWQQGQGSPASPALTMSVVYDRENTKMNWGSFFGYLFTLTLIPAWSDEAFRTELTVSSGDRVVFQDTSLQKVRSYLSVYFPTPLFVGKSADRAFANMSQATSRRHQAALASWVTAQKQAFEQELAGKSIREYQQWLKDNPDSLFRGVILKNLAANAPARNSLAWHQENLALFSDYEQYLPQDDSLWFVGPQGQRVIDIRDALRNGEDASIIAARIRATGAPYRAFDSDETALLKKRGIPATVIAAMIEVSANPRPVARAATGAVATATATPAAPSVSALAIQGNGGQYMCPWTSDGVLAEWVDKAINAKMGSAAGSAVGAYAGAKAMENVPFIGGFLGSKVGEAAGRKMAIEAAGGEQYIRSTSDLSFNSLDDMARYIQANYAGSSHYDDAIKAADEIYPGLLKAMARVSMRR